MGRDSEFGEGDIIGANNMFGRGVKFAPRVSLGKGNVYGFNTEFGKRDQVGAHSEIAKGSLAGRDVTWGKEQQFGPGVTFHPDQRLQGFDQFGHRDYGIDPAVLPESDKIAWETMRNNSNGYEADREDLQKVQALVARPSSKSASRLGAMGSGKDSGNRIETVVRQEVERANKEAHDVQSSLDRLKKMIKGNH